MIMTFEDAEQTQFSSLPDDITETILARVTRRNYPLLSLVSKRFRSLLSSMEIYKTRSLIGAEETCFYVCLRLYDQPYPSWFGLWAKPNQTLTKRRGKTGFKKDSSGNSVVLAPFSSSHSPRRTKQSTITVGSEIYIIGGPYNEPSSSVRILDCRSHTWRDAPSMTVSREDACAIFIDEKIYVMGGCDIDQYPANWFEVFDIKTQSWTALPGPVPDDDEVRNILRRNYCYGSCIVNVFEGKLYIAVGEKEYTYEPKDGTWKFVKEQSSFLSSIAAWCEIENVIYCCTHSGYLMWSDSETKSREWRGIKGLENLSEIKRARRRVFDIVNYSGKLLVMWDHYHMDNKIRYAKISLESRCNGREVWGKVECVDEFTFPCEAYKSFYCLTASV